MAPDRAPTPSTSHQDSTVGSSWSLGSIIALAVAAALVVSGVIYWRSSNSDAGREIRVATGSAGGTYNALGEALCRLLEQQQVVKSAIAVPTTGSVSNMAMLNSARDERGVDFAFVQSDLVQGDAVRLVASIYEEALHILIARDKVKEVRGLLDLRGLKVSLGAKGSGTRAVVARILEHLGMKVRRDVNLDPDATAKALRDGSLDAAFLLTAMPSPRIRKLYDEGIARFLPLGTPGEEGSFADGLATVFPSYHRVVIPIGTYGPNQTRAVQTIAVSALLVASESTDPKTVKDVARTLFKQRLKLRALAKHIPVARQIREAYEPARWAVPFHKGATDYYERNEPPFLVEYAEAISLVLTLMVGVYSGSVALRQWYRRKRKNRIDYYYNELRKRSAPPVEAGREALQLYRADLNELRQRAFDDLVGEKLDADNSFSIFQDYLQLELNSIDIRLARSGSTTESTETTSAP